MASVGVDTWGVDFGLLDARGRLLGNPVHYRDARTAGMPEVAFATVPREEIYRATGIQLMPINTLFQLLSMVRAGDPLLRQADRLLMTGDLFAHFLCGSSVAEYTNATHEPVPGPVHPRLGPPAAGAARHPHRVPARDRAAGDGARHPPPRASPRPRAWPARG